jgi:hypothetical protein
MIDQDGDAHVVPEADVKMLADQRGWTVEGIEGQVNRVANAQREDEYGGVVGGAVATGLGALRGVSAGGTDALAALIGEADTVRNYREVNPGLSTVGEIGGAVGGMFLGNTPAGAIAKLGTKVGAKGTVGAVVKGGLVEGGLTGLGTGISQVSLQEGPLKLEQAVSVLSSNMLYGAAIGGGANLAGKVLEKGIVRAKGALDEFAAARSAAPDVADDLAGLDVKQLAERELGEKARLVGDQQALRQTLPDRVSTYQREFQEANPWLVINEGEASKLLTKSKGTLRTQLDTPAGIAEAPRPTLQALRAQETALQRTLADVDGITAKLAAADAKVAKEITEKVAALTDDAAGATLSGAGAKRYRAWADVKGTGVVEIPRGKAADFIDAISSGKVAGDTKAAFDRLPAMLERNQALQADILRATSPKSELASPLLDQLKIAKDAATAGRGPKSLGEQMAGGAAYNTTAGLVSAIPVIGPFLAPFVGAKAAGLVGEQVFGRLGKATTEAAARTSKAVDAFLDVTKRITPVVPVLASKVLGAVRYAPERETRSEPAQGKPSLATSFKARSEEIRSQTAYAPDGSTVMRPQARQAMAAQLAPIRAASPIMADRMETLAARRLEFLASKLPRRADLGTLQTGPDRYQPSDLEMRTFARYAAGVEDPGGIEERLAAGQITPEDAQVMREVYPERLAEITRQIVEQLPTLRQTLPYPRRLALSILTGVAVDAAMHPRVLAVLQSQYASEEGSAGGTQAPRAQAQFGSVKSTDKATPAQERAS